MNHAKLGLSGLLLWMVVVLGACDTELKNPDLEYFPRPVGELSLLGEPAPCGDHLCYEFEVRCPEVLQRESGVIRVSEQQGNNAGVILLTSGGRGTAFFAGEGDPESRLARVFAANERITQAFRAAGFRTAELAWTRGWPVGSTEGSEGMAKLGCRPATVASWISENLVAPGGAFCAVGGSGGAAQISYMLTHYGLEDSLSLALPYAGYYFGRIDTGCLSDDPLEGAMQYDDSGRVWIDRSFGFLDPEGGPCKARDETWRKAFEEASISVGGDYFYPRTLVWQVIGGGDTSGGLRQALTYHDRLIQADSPLVGLSIIPNVPHPVTVTEQGETLIRDIVLRECRRRDFN